MRRYEGPPVNEVVTQSDAHVTASARLLRRIVQRLSQDAPLFEKSVGAIQESLATLAREPQGRD